MKIKIGDKVTTLVEKMIYGGEFYVPKYSDGIVGAVDVPCVRLQYDCRCPTFICVDFSFGTGYSRASYHKHEIKKGEN